MTLPSDTGSIELSITNMRDSTCSRIFRIRGSIEMDPSYQRQGGVWPTRTRQLFIDSLLNGFDVPKLYFHQGEGVAIGRKYAVVDGKQRLEALFDFYADGFALADDFAMANRDQIDSLGISDADLERLPGMLYSQIRDKLPEVSRALDARWLDVLIIETDDLEAIEEMFSRLNEAVPLNAAEKRNAIGGPLPAVIKDVAAEPFFVETLPFQNSRYRHFDLAAKFLLWSLPQGVHEVTDGAATAIRVKDSKRASLDAVVRDAKGGTTGADIDSSVAEIRQVLELLRANFGRADRSLQSAGTVALVFLAALRSLRRGEDRLRVDREVVTSFDAARQNREMLEAEGERRGALALLEYNRLTQSPNDGSALATRLLMLEAFAELDPSMRADRDAVLAKMADAYARLD